MAKIGRNDPCPCGSGKKYKKCCEAIAMADAAQRARTGSSPLAATPPPSSTSAPNWDEDPLDQLSNSVLDLIKAKDFDGALALCERLRNEYPDVIDWLDRSAMIHEARGDRKLAADFYQRALAFTQRPDQRDGFDEEGRDYFRRKIAQLEAPSGH